MLETGYRVGEAADGNGGFYAALQKSGVLSDMKSRGVHYVHCFSVDNAIGKVTHCVECEFADRSRRWLTPSSWDTALSSKQS